MDLGLALTVAMLAVNARPYAACGHALQFVTVC